MLGGRLSGMGGSVLTRVGLGMVVGGENRVMGGGVRGR